MILSCYSDVIGHLEKNGYRFSVFYLIHFLSHKGAAKEESAVLLFHNHSSDAYGDALMEML